MVIGSLNEQVVSVTDLAIANESVRSIDFLRCRQEYVINLGIGARVGIECLNMANGRVMSNIFFNTEMSG
jgi:hypothetical protein